MSKTLDTTEAPRGTREELVRFMKDDPVNLFAWHAMMPDGTIKCVGTQIPSVTGNYDPILFGGDGRVEVVIWGRRWVLDETGWVFEDQDGEA